MVFHECHCSLQSGFTSPEQQPRQIAYRPSVTVNDLQTNVASGYIFSTSNNVTGRNAKLIAAGNAMFNHEYNGTLLSANTTSSLESCYDSCTKFRDPSGTHCNVWVFCAADSSVNCNATGANATTPLVSAGTCQLKFQSAVTSASDRPQVLSSSTSFASGIYIAPPPKPPNHTGAIAGGVAGGIIAIVFAIAAFVFGHRLHKYWIRRTSHVPHPLAEQDDYLTFSKDFATGDLVYITDMPLLATGGNLQLALHGEDLENKTVIAVDEGNQGVGTLVFEGEAGSDQYQLPASTQGSLDDVWRIDASQLQCRRRADGELWKLGEGGSGLVYLGVLYGTTDVAIKVVTTPTPAQQKNFIKEIVILKACRHPNVISFLGASIQSEQTLLVMEAMPGGDLLTKIKNDTVGLFSWYQRGHSIALDIAKGLAFFHTHNILHLDIKSPNILIKGSEAKIADVGLGRKVEAGETIENAYGASIPWCAPEQLLGDPCTPATDMFPLGIIIWELCTGEPPSPSRNYRPVEVPKEAPASIAQLITSCLAFKPEDRPSASEAHTIIATQWEQE